MPLAPAVSRALGTLAGALPLALASCGPPSSPPPSSPANVPATGAADQDVVAVLRATWRGYLRDFVQSDGRVIDPARDMATTSEGQSYALLRAAWLDDRASFDRVWRWTQDNLATADGLFAYLWGRRGDGSWGVLDRNSATDADQDIALALLTAARRRNDTALLDHARSVVRAIWQREVAQVHGTPYVTAGPWATSTQPGPTLNPSYFAPYAYRLFAGIDAAHDWNGVVDSSYRALDMCTGAPLAAGRSAGLPPNWCILDAHDGAATDAAQQKDADAYGYDAIRVMWRVALDLRWNGDARARRYLQGSGAFLREQWQRTKRLASVYGHDGSVVAGTESLAAYGAGIGAFLAAGAGPAEQVVRDKLLSAVHRDGDGAHFGDGRNYYDQNWAWFGLALAAGQVPPPPRG